jgi:hypothetical protein
MFKIMDLAGNTRLFATAAGLLVVMDANGKYRFVYDSANQRLKLGNYSASSTRANIIIDSSGMITGYKRSGRTVAYTLHSSLVIR